MRSSTAKLHPRLTLLHRVFAFFLLTICTVVTVRADVNADKAQSDKQAYTVVKSYLTAWQKGDYFTMYGLWDAKSRQMVTAEQLRNMLSVNVVGNSDDDVKIRKLLGGASQIHRSRIASLISVRIHPETAEYATADYKVQLTFQSLMGISYALLLPDIMKQAKVMDAQTKRGDATFAVSIFGTFADQPENVSTLNDFRAITRGQDRKDEQGPYITLYLHRFTLVKEQGQWRISNAVTVSDSAPVPFP